MRSMIPQWKTGKTKTFPRTEKIIDRRKETGKTGMEIKITKPAKTKNESMTDNEITTIKPGTMRTGLIEIDINTIKIGIMDLDTKIEINQIVTRINIKVEIKTDIKREIDRKDHNTASTRTDIKAKTVEVEIIEVKITEVMMTEVKTIEVKITEVKTDTTAREDKIGIEILKVTIEETKTEMVGKTPRGIR